MFNIFSSLGDAYKLYKKNQNQNSSQMPQSSMYPSISNQRNSSRITDISSPNISSLNPTPTIFPTQTQNNSRVNNTPISASVSTPTYEQQYMDYLNKSQKRKEDLASSQMNEDRIKENENYQTNKTNLEESLKNLNDLISGIRSRSEASQARLDIQAQQNRDRAKVTSGENQRELMQTRRDQLADREKRYAAMGTIDSYGAGSFSSANNNVESDFLRMTDKNKQQLSNDLLDIDNKLLDAKSTAEERLMAEESKYNDAVLQINSSFRNNDTAKNQALRQIKLSYDQKIGGIQDEFEKSKMDLAKSKYDTQLKLQESNNADLKLQNLFSTASDQFKKTGVPQTMQDQFLVFKYPKEAETYAKIIKDNSGMGSGTQEKQKIISQIDDIMNNNSLGKILGAQSIIPILPGTPRMLAKSQIDQLKSLLSLDNRQKLKGQGAISDKEMAMLEKASSMLNQGLSESDFRQVLSQLRNEIGTGQASSLYNYDSANTVQMTSPTGQSFIVNKSEADEAIRNGWKIIK